MFVLKSDCLLNLIKLCSNKRIVFVAVGMQLRQCVESILRPPVVNEPARGFGKEEDQGGEDNGWDDLYSQTGAPLTVVGRIESDVSACAS